MDIRAEMIGEAKVLALAGDLVGDLDRPGPSVQANRPAM
jgi:hypothetical protein